MPSTSVLAPAAASAATVIRHPVPPAALTPLPVTAGVEIEANWPARLREDRESLLSTIARELRELGIPALTSNERDYSNREPAREIMARGQFSYWHVGTDCSCGIELRSRIFTHLEPMENELKQVCQVLASHNIKADDNCGLHVHLGTDTPEISNTQLSKFHQCLVRNEDNLFRLVPRNRRGNTYCHWINPDAMSYVINAARYPRQNWGARYWFHQSNKKTTEIRIQNGSVDPSLIFGWICFLEQLWNSSQAAPLDTEWKILRLIQRLPDNVIAGFDTKKEALAAASKMLRPGGMTPFLRGARKYLSQFNEVAHPDAP